MARVAGASALDWVELGRVPDLVARQGIRRLLKKRLAGLRPDDAEAAARLTEQFVAAMREALPALLPSKANAQHYELPAAFFAEILGPHRKYSACYWPDQAASLEQAEAHALGVTSERAARAPHGQDTERSGAMKTIAPVG